MSQPKKKKVVVTTRDKSTAPTFTKGKDKGKGKTKARVPGRGRKAKPQEEELIFGRQHYLLMGLGFLLVVIGLALMSGGAMDSPDEWVPERIYSFRRTVLAPALILAGLVVEIFAIFRR